MKQICPQPCYSRGNVKQLSDLPKATWREMVVLGIESAYLESQHNLLFAKLCPIYNPLTWKSTLREWYPAQGSAQTVPASGMAPGQYCLLMPVRAAWSALYIKLQKQGDEEVGRKKLWSLQFVKSACSWHNVNFFLDSNRSYELWYSAWQKSAVQHGYW